MEEQNVMPQGQAPLAGPPPFAPGLDGGMPADPNAASAEEQEIYERFVSSAYLIIYDKQFVPEVLELLEGEGDPVEGLAGLTAAIVLRVVEMADRAGQVLPEDVILHAGKEILEDLADLSVKTGIFDYEADPQSLEAAMFRALDQVRFAFQSSGRISAETATADMGELQAMDEAGELEGYFMGLAGDDDAQAQAMGAI